MLPSTQVLGTAHTSFSIRFAPVCPLDAMVTAPLLEPSGSADAYALQSLQDATIFMQASMGKQMQRMKRYYDAYVKPQFFEEGDQVLLFNIRKKTGH